VPTVDRDQILAFRLAAHHLTERLDPGSLVEAAACGIQETPIGSAAAALVARVDGLTPETLEQAMTSDRSLVGLWSVRGAPYLVPADDLGVFAAGALPIDTASFRHSLAGWSDALSEAGLDLFVTLGQMVEAARAILDGRTMNVNELRDQIYAAVPDLSRVVRPDFARDDMPEPLFRAVGTTGAICIVAGRGTDAELARVDQWLTAPPAARDPGEARAELARRFLHCYGPATAREFAEWTQRSPADAKSAFALIEEELIEVDFDRRRTLLLAVDSGEVSSPPSPGGIRLLPLLDPYLQQRDRATLLVEKESRRKLWQPTRGPGGVLVDGEVVATWRARTTGRRLNVTVDPFARLAGSVANQIRAEAERIAPFRGCETVELAIAE
jgi:hypothetical protein